MPRQSRLEPDSVTDAAMTLFWVRGYAAASIDELVQATGVARYGLYAHFGDKRGLYLAALGRYQEVVVNRLFAGVEAPDASLDQVRGYFDALLGLAASEQGRWGCLMVGAAVELAPEDDEVSEIINAYHARLLKGFSRALARARRQGLLAKGASPDELAARLLTLSQGVPVMARSGVSARTLRDAVSALAP